MLAGSGNLRLCRLAACDSAEPIGVRRVFRKVRATDDGWNEGYALGIKAAIAGV